MPIVAAATNRGKEGRKLECGPQDAACRRCSHSIASSNSSGPATWYLTPRRFRREEVRATLLRRRDGSDDRYSSKSPLSSTHGATLEPTHRRPRMGATTASKREPSTMPSSSMKRPPGRANHSDRAASTTASDPGAATRSRWSGARPSLLMSRTRSTPSRTSRSTGRPPRSCSPERTNRNVEPGLAVFSSHQDRRKGEGRAAAATSSSQAGARVPRLSRSTTNTAQAIRVGDPQRSSCPGSVLSSPHGGTPASQRRRPSTCREEMVRYRVGASGG